MFQVASGKAHTLFLTSEGRVLATGKCKYVQTYLALLSICYDYYFVNSNNFQITNFKYNYSYDLCRCMIYIPGSNSCGQLGLGKGQDAGKPKVINYMGPDIVDVSMLIAYH